MDWRHLGLMSLLLVHNICVDSAPTGSLLGFTLGVNSEQMTSHDVMSGETSDVTSLGASGTPDVTSPRTTETPDVTSLGTTETSDVTSLRTTKTSDVTSLGTTETSDVTSLGTTETSDVTSLGTTETSDVTSLRTTETSDVTLLGTTDTSDVTSLGTTETSDVTSLRTTETSDVTSLGTTETSDVTSLRTTETEKTDNGMSNTFTATSPTPDNAHASLLTLIRAATQEAPETLSVDEDDGESASGEAPSEEPQRWAGQRAGATATVTVTVTATDTDTDTDTATASAAASAIAGKHARTTLATPDIHFLCEVFGICSPTTVTAKPVPTPPSHHCRVFGNINRVIQRANSLHDLACNATYTRHQRRLFDDVSCSAYTAALLEHNSNISPRKEHTTDKFEPTEEHLNGLLKLNYFYRRIINASSAAYRRHMAAHLPAGYDVTDMCSRERMLKPEMDFCRVNLSLHDVSDAIEDFITYLRQQIELSHFSDTVSASVAVESDDSQLSWTLADINRNILVISHVIATETSVIARNWWAFCNAA